MSFKTNQDQQLTLTDSFVSLSPRTQRIVMNSWCKDFADIVFPAINEERFSVLYSSNKFSRPNTPVNFIIGALMLSTCPQVWYKEQSMWQSYPQKNTLGSPEREMQWRGSCQSYEEDIISTTSQYLDIFVCDSSYG